MSTEPSTQLSVQQQMLLEQRYKRFDYSMQAGDHLDAKASTLLQSSSIVTGLTGALAFSAFTSQPNSVLQVAALSFAFLLFLGMILAALVAWLPSSFEIPGSGDWDELFNRYIHQDLRVCYDQLLVDVEYAHQLSSKRNSRKTTLIKLSCCLFALQIVGILVLAILSN